MRSFRCSEVRVFMLRISVHPPINPFLWTYSTKYKTAGENNVNKNLQLLVRGRYYCILLYHILFLNILLRIIQEMFNSQKNKHYTFATLMQFIIQITLAYTTTFGKLNNMNQITIIMQNETAVILCQVHVMWYTYSCMGQKISHVRKYFIFVLKLLVSQYNIMIITSTIVFDGNYQRLQYIITHKSLAPRCLLGSIMT